MASRAEQIAAAVLARLTVPPMTSVVAASVHPNLRGALQSERLPAVAIETGDEPEPARVAISVVQRRVELRVTVLGVGAAGYAVLDPAHVELHARLMADPTLGGLALDVDEGAITREREDAERQRLSLTHVYRYVYRTSEESLE